MQLATTIVAGCWCDEETKHKVMDVELAEAFVKRVQLLLDTIEHFHNIICNVDYGDLSKQNDGWKAVAKQAIVKYQQIVHGDL